MLMSISPSAYEFNISLNVPRRKSQSEQNLEFAMWPGIARFYSVSDVFRHEGQRIEKNISESRKLGKLKE